MTTSSTKSNTAGKQKQQRSKASEAKPKATRQDAYSLLKSEIARLARKEVRAEVAPLKKAAAQYRSSIAALKREIHKLQTQVRRARNFESTTERDDHEGEVRHRFQARGLASHRRKLALSAEDYGALVGVTGQSIYKWERGEVRPRAKQIEALSAVRGLGKREAMARLQEQAAPAAKKRTSRGRAIG